VKLGVVKIDAFSQGKANLVDNRVKTLKQMFNSAKEVYIQIEVITDEAKLIEADGILCPAAAKLDLIVTDMEFVETRLSRCTDETEKKLLGRFKEHLDKEGLLNELTLSDAEKNLIAGGSLLTIRPVCLAGDQDLENKDALLFKAYYQSGFISFFTAGDKDSHAWSIKKGATAWDAAGAIHTDIQRGFIRAEVISYQDLSGDGSLSKARANNHLRLEMKEYVVQDGDYLVIRTNK